MFRKYLKLKNCFVITIFFMTKMYYCELSSNASQSFYTHTNAMNLFRFRDFEPRYKLKTDSSYQPAGNKRRPRGFQFHTDDRDFSVDLEFIVPFVRIPIERSMAVTQTAFRSLLNLNFNSILTTGAIVAIGGVFAIISKIIFTQYAYLNNFRKSYRKYDNDDDNAQGLKRNVSYYVSNINKIASVMESQLQENNINISHCLQSPLCSYAQANFYNVKNIQAEGLSRIIDGIFSFDFVLDYLKDTAIKSALDTARNGDNCLKVYNNCNWPLPLSSILKLVAKNLNYLNIT